MQYFLKNIMSMFQLPDKSNITSFNLNVFTNIFVSTSHMEHMFTLGKATPIFNMETFTEFPDSTPRATSGPPTTANCGRWAPSGPFSETSTIIYFLTGRFVMVSK